MQKPNTDIGYYDGYTFRQQFAGMGDGSALLIQCIKKIYIKLLKLIKSLAAIWIIHTGMRAILVL